MWSILVLSAFFLLAGSSSAQNPYGLKRPPYCSTCFTNDRRQNYSCCFYFFRCCAESRLGSNSRKSTTPNPEYPGLHTTAQAGKEHIVTADEFLHPPLAGETNCKNCRNPDTEHQKTDESRRPEAPHAANPRGDEEERANPSVPVSKFPEKTKETADNLRQKNTNNFRGHAAERNPVTSSPFASGDRRYPYNVRAGQQPARRTGENAPGNRNGGSFIIPNRSKTRNGETFEKHLDSTESKVQQNGRPGEVDNTSDVFWGRMEPVKDY